jgi:hypothetical protein
VANTAVITSSDGVYAVTTTITQDPDSGRYVVDLSITTNTSTDTLDVRVNGSAVWEGLAAEATGG